MTRSRARLPAAFVLILCCVGSAPSAAFAQAGTITKGMQTYCTNDYINLYTQVTDERQQP
jgi:hypothetical protein